MLTSPLCISLLVLVLVLDPVEFWAMLTPGDTPRWSVRSHPVAYWL